MDKHIFNSETEPIFIVTQTLNPEIIMAVFNNITTACNYVDSLTGLFSIQQRFIHSDLTQTLADNNHLIPGWMK
jgi:hypothetical protein